MDELLKLDKVSKKYPKFYLNNVSFSIKKGQIVGFIGRNGAGKTTTLKGIMNLVHFDSGTVYAFGKNMRDTELEAKQKIGFALSEINYYPNATIKRLTYVTKKFYKNFDQDKFDKLCKLFKLETNKKLEELSSGMKVKYSLAIALSHDAELLILDEPTSGLDPISRDEILDIFLSLVKDKERAILFSTHITSDLDKCASDIAYIHEGEIKYDGTKKDFINAYFLVKGDTNEFGEELKEKFISFKEYPDHLEGLIEAKDKDYFLKNNVEVKAPDLEEIMIYLERKDRHEDFTL